MPDNVTDVAPRPARRVPCRREFFLPRYIRGESGQQAQAGSTPIDRLVDLCKNRFTQRAKRDPAVWEIGCHAGEPKPRQTFDFRARLQDAGGHWWSGGQRCG